MNLAVLSELVAYWRDGYDWRAQEAALNGLPQFQASVGDTTMHFVRAEGHGPAPFPLLLAHGWPCGFNRFAKLIPLLSDPGAHGADPTDAFTIVAPSLPGYGFSTRAPHGAGENRFGTICHRLMGSVSPRASDGFGGCLMADIALPALAPGGVSG
ncbi:MAG: epoxide hydrolase family protein [Janthinobacterium lividum]